MYSLYWNHRIWKYFSLDKTKCLPSLSPNISVANSPTTLHGLVMVTKLDVILPHAEVTALRFKLKVYLPCRSVKDAPRVYILTIMMFWYCDSGILSWTYFETSVLLHRVSCQLHSKATRLDVDISFPSENWNCILHLKVFTHLYVRSKANNHCWLIFAFYWEYFLSHQPTYYILLNFQCNFHVPKHVAWTMQFGCKYYHFWKKCHLVSYKMNSP